MKFGRDVQDLVQIAETPKVRILTDEAKSSMRIYTGLPKFTEEEVVKEFYPEKTKASEYLKEYSKLFNSIEMNGTRYGIPRESVLLKWFNDTPEDFKFAPKVTQSFSHYGNLSLNFDKYANFHNSLKPLAHKLGITFLQLSENFTKKREGELVSFIKKYRTHYSEPLTIEVRDSELLNSENFISVCAQNKISIIVTDTPGKRDLVHCYLTTNILFVRFVGDDLNQFDLDRIQYWKNLIKGNSKYLSEVYFFFHIADKSKVMEAQKLLLPLE